MFQSTGDGQTGHFGRLAVPAATRGNVELAQNHYRNTMGVHAWGMTWRRNNAHGEIVQVSAV